MNTTNLIEQYIASNKLAWSPRTIVSERYRLMGLKEAITGDPGALWTALEDRQMAGYSRVTAWVRVTQFWNWMIENGHATGVNQYQVFRKKNARLFKNQYVEKIPEITFEDAKDRIAKIGDEACRKQAEDILVSGMRYFESVTHRDGKVIGKGGKTRAVYVGSESRLQRGVSYATFRRALLAVGLKPHDLRKICAAKAVELGANEFELKEMFGWAKIETATKYVRGSQSRVKELFGKMRSTKREKGKS